MIGFTGQSPYFIERPFHSELLMQKSPFNSLWRQVDRAIVFEYVLEEFSTFGRLDDGPKT